MTDHLNDPDFTDPACVAAWEEMVNELKQAEMPPQEAKRTWLAVSTTLVLARLQLGLVSGRGGVPITIQRAAALADRAERRSLSAWGRVELARCERVHRPVVVPRGDRGWCGAVRGPGGGSGQEPD